MQSPEVNQRFLFGLKVVLISVAVAQLALSASWLRRMPNPTYCTGARRMRAGRRIRAGRRPAGPGTQDPPCPAPCPHDCRSLSILCRGQSRYPVIHGCLANARPLSRHVVCRLGSEGNSKLECSSIWNLGSLLYSTFFGNIPPWRFLHQPNCYIARVLYPYSNMLYSHSVTEGGI